MPQLLRLSGSFYNASATCTQATVDETLLQLLTEFHKAHPEAYLDAPQHQIVHLGHGELLVSVLLTFSFATNLENELHPTLQHLSEEHATRTEWFMSPRDPGAATA